MRFIIGTIVKNIEHVFHNLLFFAQSLYEKHPQALFYIYENNSEDNTPELLKLLSSIYPRIIHKSEAYTDIKTRAQTWDNKPCRIECIAAARNKLLEMMDTINADDFVLMFDGDGAAPLDVDYILHLIQNFPADADAIFANGIGRTQPTYYDTYALRTHERPYGPDVVGEIFWKTLPSLAIRTRTPVLSAFGGAGIYRGTCFAAAPLYSAFPTPDLNALYQAQTKPIEQTPTHHEGVLLGIYLFEAKEAGGIFYRNNSGYAAPIVCEHSTFHATMWRNGCGRFFIDPHFIYVST
jgi:hypothetical protein